jgi:endonuclease YncB( thermonuclease family)
MSKAKLINRLPALATAALLASALPVVAADSYVGKVTDVSDGDTLVIGNGGRVKVVQLAGIDAPELTQDFGAAARDFVKNATKGKPVTVEIVETKSKQSLVARVLVDGKDLAVSLVEAGLAWSAEGSTNDLQSAQQKAKSGGEGLWASTNPTPPWEFRKSA